MTDIPYLIVAVDYALSCHGTCPTCVLTSSERNNAKPATNPVLVERAFAGVARNYGRVETLALGIGRGNVLMLGEDSVADILEIARSARRQFDAEEIILEISSSLVGKIEPQLDRARTIMQACSSEGFDARFVIVANTALSSPKYWANLDHFLGSLQSDRGGIDGDGDILQLALAIETLPPVADLVELVGHYHFPINLTWAPAFDRSTADEAALVRLGNWLAEFYQAFAPRNLDSSLVNRLHQAFDRTPAGVVDLVAHVRESARAVVYVAPDGGWHHGMFTILAEMDPVRFDPLAVRTKDGSFAIAANPGKDIARLLRNPACGSCPFMPQCVTSGGHQIGLMTLRRHPQGTTVCPSGLRPSFEIAARSTPALERVA